MILPEHAGTLLFAIENACRDFAADKGVCSCDSNFASFFGVVFWQFWSEKKGKNQAGTDSAANLALRRHFGGLWGHFGPDLGAWEDSLGGLGAPWGGLGRHFGGKKRHANFGMKNEGES